MVLKCLHYNYDTETTCTHSYEKCAKEVFCQDLEHGHHCFLVWKVEGNVSTPISGGCNKNWDEKSEEKCANQCIGSVRGPRYYCCCSDNLCNSNFRLPNNTATTSSITTTPDPTQTLIIPKPHPDGHYPNGLLLSSIPIVLITAFICAYIYKFRRRLFKNSGLADTIRRSNHDKNLTPNELNELANNHNLSILTPFRKAFGVAGETGNYHANNNNNHHYSNNHHTHHNHNQSNHHHQQQQQDFNNLNHRSTNHHDANQQMNRINLSSITLLEVIGSGRFGTVHRAKIKQTANGTTGTDSTNNNNSNNNDLNFNNSNTTNNNNNVKHDNDAIVVEMIGEQDKDVDRNELSEIAVKIIMSSDHQSWMNEQQVYNLPKLKHKNILNFITSDEHLESETYWLVVEYASKGSLYNYIKDNTITWEEFLHISIGIVHGLAHLHEIEIAHRDFKSKNVLLRHDLTPCITDFGVAAILDTTQGSQLDSRKKYLQVGTPRYMAPEVLECSVTFTKSSFTKIDVYALSLVLWELLSRCYPMFKEERQQQDERRADQLNHENDDNSQNQQQQLQQPPEPYKMPFEDEAGPQPDINQMRQIVVVKKKRPALRNEWRSYPVSEFCRAIEDGWEYDCDARISASCFVERVDSVLEEDQNIRVVSS